MTRTPLRVAYADPPYIGKAKKHYGLHPDYAGEVDFAGLIQRLTDDFPDGWALSCNSTNLRTLLPVCPVDTRVAAWVKPFAVFKKGVNPIYAWEPVLFRGGGSRQLDDAYFDWVKATPMMGGFVGAKPEEFSFWVFRLLRLRPGDELVDMFPGSGAVTRAWEKWQRQLWRAA
jgi:hypothetical protein